MRDAPGRRNITGPAEPAPVSKCRGRQARGLVWGTVWVATSVWPATNRPSAVDYRRTGRNFAAPRLLVAGDQVVEGLAATGEDQLPVVKDRFSRTGSTVVDRCHRGAVGAGLTDGDERTGAGKPEISRR